MTWKEITGIVYILKIYYKFKNFFDLLGKLPVIAQDVSAFKDECHTLKKELETLTKHKIRNLRCSFCKEKYVGHSTELFANQVNKDGYQYRVFEDLCCTCNRSMGRWAEIPKSE